MIIAGAAARTDGVLELNRGMRVEIAAKPLGEPGAIIAQFW